MSYRRDMSNARRYRRWSASLLLCAAGWGSSPCLVEGFQQLQRSSTPSLGLGPSDTSSRYLSSFTLHYTNSQNEEEVSLPLQDVIPSSSSPANPLVESFSQPAPPRKQKQQKEEQWYESEEYQQRRNQRREWLDRTTDSLLATPPGSLIKGKWHELASMLSAWSSFIKSDADAPLRMEAILKRLHEERRAGNQEAVANIDMYNRLLDAWACAALFKTQGVDPKVASQRAREILVLLQETYEEEGDEELMPNEESFNLVLHAVCRTEGPTIARRLLALMEYLHRSGKNPNAKPGKTDYTSVLQAYTKPKFQRGNAKHKTGALVEGFLRHMNMTGITPDTYHYNLAMKAWTQSKKGRTAAEHADNILEYMQAPKDIVTYGSVISAWAASGMKAHAVQRSEELLRKIEESEPHLEPNTVVLNAVMSTWVKSKSPGASNRTGELLQEMEQSTEPSIQPDLISYNTHLHALSMQAKKRGMAQRADSLLTKMEDRYEKGEVSFAPNLFSYNLVIEAWSKSSVPNSEMRAAQVLRKLAKRPGVEPDAFSFHQVLAALARKGSAKTAEELLVYMDKAHRTGVHPNAKPDSICYEKVIQAYARSGEKGAAAKAERLLHHMKDRYFNHNDKDVKPNRNVYNAVINCWARSGEGTLAARKAEALLKEMQQLREEYHDESMAPNLVTFNCLLNAWALSGTRCCGHKAESYLNQMWELYNAGDNDLVKPNEKSYNTVINAISKSKNEAKAQRALRILRRMDKLYQAGNKEARPNEVTYTAVLNSCAFPAVLDERTRRKALDTAIFTLDELSSSRYGAPNQITYGTFFKAVRNLMPSDDQLRRAIIKEAFQQCCKDGQVGDMVLTHLKDAAPADLYDELVVEPVRNASARNPPRRITPADLPSKWSSNVQARKSTWRPPRSTKKTRQKVSTPRPTETTRQKVSYTKRSRQ